MSPAKTMRNTNTIHRRQRPAPQHPFVFFAPTFKGLEATLAEELVALGASEVQAANRGVDFKGSLETLYQANLHLRCAHRVLWHIATFPAADRTQLYEGVRALPWGDHLALPMTLAVDTVGTNANLVHTQFTSRVVKDGVVDWFRDQGKPRPDVDLENPDLALNARISGDTCTLSWDTSGDRLHQRGYRGRHAGPAPLKENLAAALLRLSGYDGTQPLVDPLCGSGTLLIEAAMMAKNIPPGLLGRRFAFTRHPTYDARLWANIQGDARAQIIEPEGCPIIGYDISEGAVRAAATGLAGAGVDDIVRLKRQPLAEMGTFSEGMIVTNPPYGERIGDIEELIPLYETLGSTFKHKCQGMSAHVLTSSKFLGGRIGLKTYRRDAVWNGPLECRLLHYELY